MNIILLAIYLVSCPLLFKYIKSLRLSARGRRTMKYKGPGEAWWVFQVKATTSSLVATGSATFFYAETPRLTVFLGAMTLFSTAGIVALRHVSRKLNNKH